MEGIDLRKIGVLLFTALILLGCTKTEYWSESELCDSKEQCIELGEEYGEDIFDTLEGAFNYTNQGTFLRVGLDTDQYAEDGVISLDEFIVAEYEKSDGEFELVEGEEHPFY